MRKPAPSSVGPKRNGAPLRLAFVFTVVLSGCTTFKPPQISYDDDVSPSPDLPMPADEHARPLHVPPLWTPTGGGKRGDKEAKEPADRISTANDVARVATRAAVIKYVANVSSGVHSDAPKEAGEKLLELISHNNKISYDKDKDHYTLNLGDNPNKEFSYTPESIDIVLVELLATARFIVEAPDIINLEKVVRQVLMPPSS